ncbi:MAG TPA: right-handed parallel beta-helix repeat-containing protein [Polyangiaceae bacterium]|nr:right-handed parallel beta-helix repeat-containing protein [Polyangiaceae bacterium]
MKRVRACCIGIVAVSFVVSAAACGGGGSSSTPDGGPAEASTPDATQPGDAPSDEASAHASGPDAPEEGAADAPDAASDAPADTTDAGPCATDFWVDPTGGNDMTGTGCASTDADAGTTSCAWRTITHATQAIGRPCGPTRLHVIGPATFGAAETYPLQIRQNVVLTTEGGAIELDVPPTTAVGISVTGAGSGIRGGPGAPLTITGAASADGGLVAGAQIGIDFQFNAVSTLENVVVSYFSSSGIKGETGSSLDVPQGLVATSNYTGAYLSGSVTIHVDRATTSFNNNTFGVTLFSGAVSVVGTSGGMMQVNGNGNGFALENGASLTIPPTAAASFDGNTGTALTVEDTSSVTMTGTPGVAPGTGTITVSNNPGNGIIFNAPTTGAASQSTLTGVVVYGNGARGVYIDGAGAPRIKMRRSIVLANGFNGVWIDHATNVASVDLGTTDAGDGGVDYGYNVLQAAPDAGPNAGAGLCLSSAADAGVVTAAGNVFSGPRDCSLLDAGMLTSTSDCSGNVDVGIFPGAGDVLTANCAH